MQASPTTTVTNLATPTWTTVASMLSGRTNLAAASNSDGRIHAIGGNTFNSYLSTAEAYHP